MIFFSKNITRYIFEVIVLYNDYIAQKPRKYGKISAVLRELGFLKLFCPKIITDVFI